MFNSWLDFGTVRVIRRLDVNLETGFRYSPLSIRVNGSYFFGIETRESDDIFHVSQFAEIFHTSFYLLKISF